MRIYDDENRKSLQSILIMLTPAEVNELIGYLKGLNINNDHCHVDDQSYKREITIGLYTPQTVNNFSDEVIQLLKEDD